MNTILILVSLCFLQFSLAIVPVDPFESQNATGLVRHIVTFNFAPDVDNTTQLHVMDVYLSLQYKCTNPNTGEQDGGFANSPEGLDQHMKQGYIVSFASVAERNYFVGRPFFYPYDPYHDAFKQFVKQYLNETDGVFVFDFTVVAFNPNSTLLAESYKY